MENLMLWLLNNRRLWTLNYDGVRSELKSWRSSHVSFIGKFYVVAFEQ
jgi:hypothetical protein